MAVDDYDAGAGATVHESAGQVQPEPETAAEDPDQEILQEIIDNYALVCEVESAQRAQEDDDLVFEGDDMWTPEARASRAEHIDDATGQKVPARPIISVNLAEQKIQELMSEARQARLGITVQPKAGLANTKMAGYYKGIIRSIQADSGATENRLWALERTAKCGRGGYRIDLDYNNDGDFDLDILSKRILDQSTIYWDPYSVMADHSDALWVILAEWISEKTRLRRWKNKPLVAPSGAFEDQGNKWFTINDQKQKSILIVTYYRVEFEDLVLAHHPKLGTLGPAPKGELPPEIQEAIEKRHPSVQHRPVQKRSVRQYIVDGTQVLEQDPWPGKLLPVIPTVGKEYLIKGKRSWKGLVTNIKDLSRGYIVTLSSAVEAAASMPRAPYIMAAGQDEGFEEMWDDSPIKAYTRLYYNAVSVDGKVVGAPQRQNLEPAIQGALLLARVLKDDVGTVTGRVDPASRSVRPYDRSGRAIEALQKQGASGTSNYLDNLATVSMLQEGRVYVDLIPVVLDRPGRIIAVMGEDHDDETAIMIKVPFIRDKDGTPVAVPCPKCGGSGKVRGQRSMMDLFPAPVVCPDCQGLKWATKENMPEQWQGKTVEYVDLAEGQFKVAVNIGRNFMTKQDEAMAAMSQLATAAPALVPVYADLWVRAMGFSGSTEIADRIKRMNPNAKSEEDGSAEVPPEFAQKFQALQMEHQAAMQALQAATKAIETDQVKAESAERIAAMRLEAAEGLENLRNQNRLMADTAKAEQSEALERMKAEIETMQQENEQAHERMLETLQQRHAEIIEAIRAETKIALADKADQTAREELAVDSRHRIEEGRRADEKMARDEAKKKDDKA